MAALRFGPLALLWAVSGAATAVTPVQKVISLLTDLKTQVEAEGVQEAGTYDQFACFCRTTTASKSQAITSGRDNIGSLSADIEEKTATKQEKSSELAKRQGDHEAWSGELQETEVRCAKAQAEYEATAADLSKAISSLDAAIQAMETSKPSLLAIRQAVKRSLALADSLNLVTGPRRRAVSAFLEGRSAVDPADPTYKYHSQGIIETLNTLLKDFRGEKQTLDEEWGKTEKTCNSTKLALEQKLLDNGKAMETLSGDISTLKGEIASARESLVVAEGVLKDDQQYLKDLTERCETRAKDWDQRSQMRADELAALTGALEVLSQTVSGLDAEVNKRALLLERKASSPRQAREAAAPARSAAGAAMASVSRHLGGLDFLQESASGRQGHARGLLRGAHAAAHSATARQEGVVQLLRQEGQRLQSTALSALAMRAAADPFAKVKRLIQQLVERLLAEATSEATKKGFCDEQLGLAYGDRDNRFAEAKKLDVEIKMLEIKKDELEAEISLLTGALAQLAEDLTNATTIRAQEKTDNLEAIQKAKEGLAAVEEAITILKVFYKRAAKATVLLQASPVDEDTAGAGFAGAYRGRQEASKGILGLLEVIKTDFERTVRTTEAAEKTAHAEFVEFDRASRADISGKDMTKTRDEEELATTDNTIAEKMADLQTAQDLLDAALKKVEDLKPTCIDTGMSYAERVQKREEEIAALRKALCILDADGVEPDCPPPQ